MTTIHLIITVIAWVAAIANDSMRVQLLAALFGETMPESLGLDAITPEDAVYADGIYEICHPGHRVIRHLTGAQVSNLLAYGITVAHTVDNNPVPAGRVYTAYHRTGERIMEFQAKTKAVAVSLFRAAFPGFPRNEIVWVRA